MDGTYLAYVVSGHVLTAQRPQTIEIKNVQTGTFMRCYTCVKAATVLASPSCAPLTPGGSSDPVKWAKAGLVNKLRMIQIADRFGWTSRYVCKAVQMAAAASSVAGRQCVNHGRKMRHQPTDNIASLLQWLPAFSTYQTSCKRLTGHRKSARHAVSVPSAATQKQKKQHPNDHWPVKRCAHR